MELLRFSETSANFQGAIRHHIAEDIILLSHSFENIKSNMKERDIIKRVFKETNANWTRVTQIRSYAESCELCNKACGSIKDEEKSWGYEQTSAYCAPGSLLTMYWTTEESGIDSSLGPKYFSLLYGLHTVSWVHQASCIVGTGDYFFGSKATGVWSWSLTSV
jgi:hypothetical protein